MESPVRSLRLLLLVPALVSISPASLQADASAEPAKQASRAEAHAKGADGAIVTQANLLASERHWPYQVALIEPWRPAGRAQPLAKGSRGVLIRVEASGEARIDFGRDGQHDVPVRATDLLANANRIRLGEIVKMAPNFALAIGPRLVSSATTPPRLFGLDEAAGQRGFLCVFADSNAEGFGALAKALAPLAGRHGVSTILFPQGAQPDARIAERLRSLEWTVPFVLDHVSEAYTRTLLSEKTALPAVALVTSEGRLLLESSWKADLAPELTAALDAGFGAVSGSPR